jgi:hypothetical protein
MKVGRNDPCPCGSGKKYKKCCIDRPIRITSNINTIPIEKEVSDYKYIEPNSERLVQVVSQYAIQDVIKAAFCINCWRNNRSVLAQALTLNMAIYKVSVYGEKRIETFSDLSEFYDQISPFLEITPREDLTLNDFGEVYISYRGEEYPVILGTGHEQVYAAMRFMLVLADILDRSDELSDVLCYCKTIINALEDTNISESENEICFELPSESFWSSIQHMFSAESFREAKKKAFKAIGYQTCPIEMRHFVSNGNESYPLYNSSVLVDYYKHLLSLATKAEYLEHIEKTILEQIENAYNFSDNKQAHVLIAPRIVDRNTHKNVTSNRFLFAAKDRGRLIIALNKDRFANNADLQKELSLTRQLHMQNQLSLAESVHRKGLKRCYGIDIKADGDIEFLLMEPLTDITSHGSILGEANQVFTCTALDMIYLLGFSENIAELIDYIEYDETEPAQILAFGGKSSLFFTWKNANRHIASGAIEYNLISVSYGTSDDFVFNYFKDTLSDFPSAKYELFSDPLCWTAQLAELGYLHIEHKGCFGFGGEVKRLGEHSYVFLAHNVEYFEIDDFTNENHIALKTIDDLNQRLFNRYSHCFNAFSILKEKVLQVLYMPKHYAETIDCSGFTKDKTRKYVNSDEYIYSGTIIIRYSVNTKALLDAIINAADRSVESDYFVELLQPLRKYSPDAFEQLVQEAKNDSCLPLTVGVSVLEQDYYYSDMAIDINIEAINYVRARKEIAKVCYNQGIVPGEYRSRDATAMIRKMQVTVVNIFEEQLSNFSKDDLHLRILEYYAVQLQGVIINMKRYASFKNLDEQVREEFEEKTRTIREDYRRSLRTAQYLLESNLAITHSSNSVICGEDDLKNLIAFADWLVVLQDNADTCHHTEFDVSFIIDNQYKVDTTITEVANQQYQDILLRKYQTDDYHIKNDTTDKDYFRMCIDAFYLDTGVDFGMLISLIEYMQLGIIVEGTAKEIFANVYEVFKGPLIHGFIDTLMDKQENDMEFIEKALNFIVLDETNLKMLDNKYHDILPIWDRENRNNRFDVKPIIMRDDKYIFSPIVLKQLCVLWKSGIIEWYLPFEIGLDSVKGILGKWKKRYEDEMVEDIAKLFTDYGCSIVEPEIELSTRFPKENYPNELGDYDIIAINEKRKEIWLIESKVLQKVGSIYEAQMQQKSFFFQHEDDKKFQRRIDFFNNNHEKILTSLKVSDDNYTILPYMITNKPFMSRYKSIEFPIIAYYELKNLLSAR